MSKHTLENLLIFSIIYCNTYRSNKGKVYPDYINDKSNKYLGIDILDFEDVNIDDFAECVNFSHHIYEPIKPHTILERIKNKIPLHELRNDNNIVDDGINFFGRQEYRINGLDAGNSKTFKTMYAQLDEEYFKKTLREIKSHMLLE